MMKLVIAIIHNDDVHKLRNALIENDFRVTKLSTSGGFLRAENATLLMGVDEERLNELLGHIREICHTRNELVVSPVSEFFTAGPHMGLPLEVTVGGATVFVLDVEQFIKI
ncbi:MAG: cyclic-di-AMP receptor [Peptostreptococcaceae bacterium]|nr:cyclic-di-AMP receptor [Peptostreptococcaceae bacterium]